MLDGVGEARIEGPVAQTAEGLSENTALELSRLHSRLDGVLSKLRGPQPTEAPDQPPSASSPNYMEVLAATNQGVTRLHSQLNELEKTLFG